MFSQETVFNFLSEKKGSNLADLILLVQGRNACLNVQQLIGLVVASIALGNACWQGSVKMLSNKAQPARDIAIASLKPYIRKVFGLQLAGWLCTYWKVTEQLQLDLLHSFSFESTGVDTSVLKLSLVTSI